ncbi:MAG: undecaprenyl diphosphate synthase family protein, partial [Candidatus Micrarchaeota archaeon]|nr:undecaprenyl diphosphate synthase family protein [Candidatus Micrarchaeota archaeon]
MRQPASIAIIPDGNRRFAQKNALGLVDAYRAGFAKVQDVLSWTNGTDVSSVRLWALSLENFQKRSQMELRILFQLMRHQFRASLADPRFQEEDIRVRFFGKKDLLPKSVQDGMQKLEEKTAGHQKELGVAIAYSGREELAAAAQAAALDLQAGKIDAITESTLQSYLY